MKKTILFFAVLLLVVVIFNSCDKSPGYGGNSGITGVLKVRRYNSNFSKLKQETTLANSDVYIVFKDGQGYGDKVKTSFDGSFIFNHLVPGDYKIFAYSADTTMLVTVNIPITVSAKISKANELVDVGVIKVADNKTLSGNASIVGKVISHKANVAYNAINEKVFMMEVGDSTNSNYVFTDYNGNYLFNNLPVGDFKVYVYSKNTLAAPPYVIIDTTVSILKNNQVINLPDFNIDN